MKCLFGVYSKDEGTILLDGQEVSFKNSKEALENGVAMVHQELNQALEAQCHGQHLVAATPRSLASWMKRKCWRTPRRSSGNWKSMWTRSRS